MKRSVWVVEQFKCGELKRLGTETPIKVMGVYSRAQSASDEMMRLLLARTEEEKLEVVYSRRCVEVED